MGSDKKAVCQQKKSRKLLRMSYLGHIFNDMYWFIIPLLLPTIRAEFRLTYTQSGMLLTAYTLVGAFSSLLTGYLGDKIGRRFILSWGFLLGSLALVLCTLSASYVHLFAALIILGVGISAFHPSMIAVLSNSFPYRRGNIFGIFQFWGTVGTFSMVLTVSFLMRIFLSWRLTLLILSIPGFVFAPIIFKSLKPLLENDGAPVYLEKERNDTKTSHSTHRTISLSVFIIFMLANALFVVTQQGVINFTPTFLVEVKELSLPIASYSFLIIVAGGFFGTIASGKVSEKLSSLTALLLFVAIGGPLILLITQVKTFSLLLTFLAIYGISHFGVWAPQQAYLAENTPENIRGGVYGIIFFLMSVVGAVAPAITGLLADQVGLSSALMIITIPIFASFGIIFALKRYSSFFLSCVTFFSG